MTPTSTPNATVEKASAKDNVHVVLRGPDGKLKQEISA
jgi:hypothetical protein